MAVDVFDNVYVVGWTSDDLEGENAGAWTPDAYIRKYSSTGDELWTRQFGTSEVDTANAVAVDASGNIVVAGNTGGALDGPAQGIDAFVRSYDPDGNLVWARQFGTPGDDTAQDMAVDSAGNIVVFGDTTGQFAYGESGGIYLRKFDGDGQTLWTRQFGPFHYTGRGVAVDSAGEVVIVGNTLGSAFVSKLDTDGALLWTREFTIASSVTVEDVAVGPDGTLFVVGEVRDTRTTIGNLNFTDSLVRTYGPDGDEIWTAVYEGFGATDGVDAVAIEPGGMAVVVGREDGDVFVRRISSWTSNVLSTRVFGSEESDYASDVALSASGATVVVGYTNGDLAAESFGKIDAFVTMR